MDFEARVTRRALAGPLLGLAGAALLDKRAEAARRPGTRRVVIVMVDGLGLDYLDQSDMPTLKRWAKEGLFRKARGLMPAVTNANNASICCGVPPRVHGITGNSYLDERTGREEFMEDGALLLAPTIFQRAAALGVRSALLSSKKKIRLLRRGADLAVAAEEPEPAFVDRYGAAPPIYSAEINDWLWRVAVDLLRTRPDFGCLYVHTTDYPMHMWPPEAQESRAHLAKLDARLAEAAEAAPDAVFYVTADHGLNAKSRARDLDRACRNRGLPLRAAISAEKDRYPKHHRGLGGTAWVYLQTPGDAPRAMELIRGLAGVEDVLTRDEAARRFDLMASRIGDLVVTGDKVTVFGQLADEQETLDAGYRSHGSAHELDIPLICSDAGAIPAAESLRFNYLIAAHLFPGG